MGNRQVCLSRNKQPETPTSNPQMFQAKKITSLNQQHKNKFIYQYSLDSLCRLSREVKGSPEPPNPYSPYITRKIIQLQVILQNLPQLDPYQSLKDVYTEYAFLRCMLMLNRFNLQHCVDLILEDITFKTCIRLDLANSEHMLLDAVKFVGEDFNRSLCIGIKINLHRGKLKLSTIRNYLIYFIEWFWYDIAKRNSLHYELLVLIDCGQSDFDIKFVQFLIELSLRHYPLTLSKVFLVNMNLEMISSETGSILAKPAIKHFVYPFGAEFKRHLPKYLRKSTLLKEYGGHHLQKPPIPLNIEEARSIVF